MTAPRGIIAEARSVERVRTLVALGARLQLLESVSTLSRERLTRIYREAQGKSPPKGMLPFSTDWFMTWQPNIHSSLFLNLYQRVIKATNIDEADALILSYRLYGEQVALLGHSQALSITRAWRLIKFVDSGMLTLTPCTCCRGQFVVHTYDLVKAYRCGLCAPPSRAGKGREWRDLEAAGPPALPQKTRKHSGETVTA